jgi:hypothetical protein
MKKPGRLYKAAVIAMHALVGCATLARRESDPGSDHPCPLLRKEGNRGPAGA